MHGALEGGRDLLTGLCSAGISSKSKVIEQVDLILFAVKNASFLGLEFAVIFSTIRLRGVESQNR
jgi:hypothetical protein